MTKTLFTSLLLAVSLTGCAKLPAVGEAPQVERVVKLHAYGTPAPKATGEAPADPYYVSHSGGIQYVAPVASAAPGQLISEGGAGAAKRTSTLEVTATPSATYRAIPEFATQDAISDVKVSPATPATWEVSPSWGVSVIGKVKLALTDQDGANEDDSELSPADLGWVPAIADAKQLPLTAVKEVVTRFLVKNPASTRVNLSATLEGADGAPLQSEAGRPVTLSLSLSVN